ncbi:hypothetical protein K2X33_12660 [bacterium]|nr:hypothetical protein [bacterium]
MPKALLCLVLGFVALSVPAVSKPPPEMVQKGSVNNGGNGSDGQMQWVLKNLLLPSFELPENRAVLEPAEIRALADLIEKGPPFVAVDPKSLKDLPEERFTDKLSRPAKVKLGERDGKEAWRLLDNRENAVDARVVWDANEKAYTVQWDEAAWKAVTYEGKLYPQSVVRDIAHELLRYAYHAGLIQRNDDNRGISNQLKLREGVAVQSLPTDAYRLDFARRGKEMAKASKEMIRIVETDLKTHSDGESFITDLRHNLPLMENFNRAKDWPGATDEEIASIFDAYLSKMLVQRANIDKQKKVALTFEPPKVTPSGPRDFPARAKLLYFEAHRLFNLIHYHASVRDSRDGRAWSKYLEQVNYVVDEYARSKYAGTDAQFEQWFNQQTKDIRAEFERLKTALGYDK